MNSLTFLLTPARIQRIGLIKLNMITATPATDKWVATTLQPVMAQQRLWDTSIGSSRCLFNGLRWQCLAPLSSNYLYALFFRSHASSRVPRSISQGALLRSISAAVEGICLRTDIPLWVVFSSLSCIIRINLGNLDNPATLQTFVQIWPLVFMLDAWGGWASHPRHHKMDHARSHPCKYAWEAIRKGLSLGWVLFVKIPK